MIVEAVRDDGAVMVTEGRNERDGAAVVLPGGQVFYLPKGSLYARGGWEAAPSKTPVPDGVDPDRLAAARGPRVAGAD